MTKVIYSRWPQFVTVIRYFMNLEFKTHYNIFIRTSCTSDKMKCTLIYYFMWIAQSVPGVGKTVAVAFQCWRKFQSVLSLINATCAFNPNYPDGCSFCLQKADKCNCDPIFMRIRLKSRTGLKFIINYR